MELDNAPYGGARYPVSARVDGRSFVGFHLDAGIGDHVLEPVEMLKPRDWLGFAGIPTIAFPLLSPEQQFAEKYHAYTLPRGSQVNSRVRDLMDILLLIRCASLAATRVREAVRATFARRRSHPVPGTMPDPPTFWKTPFDAMAASCRVDVTIADAVREVREFVEKALS